MADYTITLSDAEDKALGVVAVSKQEWIENVVKERCRISIDEIVNSEVQRKLNAGETITGTKEEIVMAATILSAAEEDAQFVAQLAAKSE